MVMWVVGCDLHSQGYDSLRSDASHEYTPTEIPTLSRADAETRMRMSVISPETNRGKIVSKTYRSRSVGGRASRPDQSRLMRSSAPSGSLPSLDEEVWVIVKPAPDVDAASPDSDDDIPGTPGSGAIVARFSDGDDGAYRDVPLPLKHTDVDASISAYIASVTVTQQFHNPFDEKIEAVYVFPLPQNAAVNGFVMTIGERKIRGIIREREEAEQIYAAARSQGHVASLLTQERANIFTQHVANIEPGKQIDVNITYFNTLSYDDGWYEFVFPMVVGPRFNPPGYGEGVGAVARSDHGLAGQATEIEYLRPDERSGHDITVNVEINVGAAVEEIVCNSHQIDMIHEASEYLRVALSEEDSIPNKDFVLRYRVAGKDVKTALLTHDAGEDGGYFTFMLYPPRELDMLERRPMEMIFVLDCSGSMSGQPIAQAKAAIDHALTQLQPQDTFQIIQFSNDASQLGKRPVAATRKNIQRGRTYVRSLSGGGGTMMIEGIKAALDFPHDPERLRFVTFLTDGFIGNEVDILAAVHQRVDSARIFSFGVGSASNRYLLNRMAKLGNGAVAYLGLHDDGAMVMDQFFARVSHPVMTDIEIDFGAMSAHSMMPQRLPDLFVGRPVVVSGRFDDNRPTTMRVRGNVEGNIVETTIEVNPLDETQTHQALAAVWARMHIADLADQATYDANIELPQRITEVALRYSLMSAYTSFVAVDSKTQTAGAHGTTVHQAVPVPEGVKYETTVRDPG